MKKLLIIVAIAITCFSFSGISNSGKVKLQELKTERVCFPNLGYRNALLALRILNISASGGYVTGYNLTDNDIIGQYCYDVSWIEWTPLPED